MKKWFIVAGGIVVALAILALAICVICKNDMPKRTCEYYLTMSDQECYEAIIKNGLIIPDALTLRDDLPKLVKEIISAFQRAPELGMVVSYKEMAQLNNRIGDLLLLQGAG